MTEFVQFTRFEAEDGQVEGEHNEILTLVAMEDSILALEQQGLACDHAVRLDPVTNKLPVTADMGIKKLVPHSRGSRYLTDNQRA